MLRALFCKTGRAVYISHLDLMRIFQRAFQRAGLPLTHTQGFNPRPFVSIALPMSLGMDSVCELMDFELDGNPIPAGEIRDRLNSALVEGIQVLEVYDGGLKIKNLAYLRCRVTLEYDAGIAQNTARDIRELFRRDSLTVTKKGKSGITDVDVVPMIRELTVTEESDRELALEAVVCCQNPTLNPMLLGNVISKYLPEAAPDFLRCSRVELYDKEMNVFR